MDKNAENFYHGLSEDQKKWLEGYDRRIRMVRDKTPKEFFDARKNGGEIYDADILQILKMIDFAKGYNNPDNYRRLLVEVSNKICRLHEQWLDTEIKLNELQNNT